MDEEDNQNQLIMYKTNLKYLGILLTMVCCNFSAGIATTLKSPNGQVVLNFDIQDLGGMKNCPVYDVSFKGRLLVDQSRLGFTLGDGSTLTDHFKVLSMKDGSYDNTWEPVYGERSTIRDHYNELVVELSHEYIPDCRLNLIFRCYNSGVAFRYSIPKDDFPGDSVMIKREHTEFNFLNDHTGWVTKTSQGIYTEKPISEMGQGVCRPLTIKVNDNTYLAIAEAALVDFARGQLACSEDHPFGIAIELGSEVRSSLPLTTPWRVLMVAASPGELLENNDIILNLNEPCAIEDPSWIKPGKVIRAMGNTIDVSKAYIDFAVKHNLEYASAGWKVHTDGDCNPMKIVSRDGLDLSEAIEYAKPRGIGIIVYVDHLALEKYPLEEVFSTYQKWGVSGVKFGFVNVGPQEWTSWLHKAVRIAAKYQLVIDIHDEYRPTGYSRTYPNLMTQEGINGDESKPSNRQSLTTLFTRMLAGAGDNTICYYNSRVDKHWTHAYQLAKAVCIYSPLNWIYWYDRPAKHQENLKPGNGIIGDEPELEFFDHVPTVWDDTKVIHGSIGEYAVIARRSGKDWYIGAMNSEKDRSLEVPLDFLSPKEKYVAHIYFDDPPAKTRTHVGIQRSMVDAGTTLKVDMSAQGGQAIRIVPAEPGDNYPLYDR